MNTPNPPVVDEVLDLTTRIKALLEQIEAAMAQLDVTEGTEDD